MATKRIKLLLVEDDTVDQAAFAQRIRAEGHPYDYVIAGSVAEALAELRSGPFDVVLMDYKLDHGTAFAALSAAVDAPVIILSNDGDEETAVRAMKIGDLVKDPGNRQLKGLPHTVENAIRDYASLKRSRILSHTVMSINDSVYITDMDDTVIFVNKAFCETYGFAEEDVIGRQSGLLWRDGSSRLEERDTLVREGRGEFHHQRKDGSVFPVALSRSTVRDEQGKETAVVVIGHDITERKCAETSLQESEKRFRTLVEATTNYVYTVFVDEGRPVSTKHGPGCLSVTGYSSEEYDADPNLWYRMVYEPDREAVLGQAGLVLKGTAVRPLEHRIIHKDGSTRWVRNTPVPHVDENGRLVSYDGLITSITEEKKLKAQLLHAQKMEAVGQLAGGIAHDFNNILTAIIAYASLIEMDSGESSSQKKHGRKIIALSERAAQLVKSLLTFSRKQIIDPKPVKVNDIVKKTEKLLKRLIGEDIRLRSVLAAGDMCVLADSGLIEQVLMNMATNARDAMPGGGQFTIETGTLEMDEAFIKNHGYGESGTYAFISMRDTGCGMDEKTRERIFEPFFTTKEAGKGTGLGLSMAYGIVMQHNGYINLRSEPEKGTTFQICLPMIAARVEDAGTGRKAAPKKGTETVLLAEDDAEVRKMTKNALTQSGYKVIEASDGAEALSKFMRRKGTVRLLILDLMMPKISGKEVFDEIRRRRPDIRALFMSGHADEVLRKKGMFAEGVNFISKPVSPETLLSKVREALDT